MPYLELSVELGGLDPDATEAACVAAGALAVSYADAHDEPVLEPRPGELKLWRHTRLTALFAAERADPELIVRFALSIGVDISRLTARAVADRVWEREWLRDFHARRFGRRLWICPRHERVEQADSVVVRLDPGLAFGTGTHPSTAQCLAWLDQCECGGRSLLDYGCGSGVLGIAALKLGAQLAYAFDIDPQALIATRDNAIDNGVGERLIVCARSEDLPRSVDVLVANILAPILIELAPQLAQRLRPGGQALLAGVLTAQRAEVASAFLKWFDMDLFGEQDGWVALAATRH